MTDSINTWREKDGDNTYALDWPIGEDSLVWEIGGYEGRWAAQMAEKFNPTIDIFEPQTWAFVKMAERFWGKEKIRLHPHGLWIDNVVLPLHHVETDGASILNEGGKTQDGVFEDVYDALKAEPKDIDVGLMNIEGAEFILLPYMIGLGLMERFRFFWCQFHTFADPSGDRKGMIYNGMQRTHDIIWDFYPTAVAWELKRPISKSYVNYATVEMSVVAI